MKDKKPIHALEVPASMAARMAEIMNSGEYIVLMTDEGVHLGTVIPPWSTPPGVKMIYGE